METRTFWEIFNPVKVSSPFWLVAPEILVPITATEAPGIGSLFAFKTKKETLSSCFINLASNTLLSLLVFAWTCP